MIVVCAGRSFCLLRLFSRLVGPSLLTRYLRLSVPKVKPNIGKWRICVQRVTQFCFTPGRKIC